MILSILKIIIIVILTIVLSIIAIILLPFNYKGVTFYCITKIWSKIVLFLAGVNLQVTGMENLKNGRNFIFISNHASQFDIPVVLATIPQNVRLVAKKELTKIPIFGLALKYGGFVIIDRAKSREAMLSIEKAAERIKQGLSVLLFAEGTRSDDGSVQPFKRGAFSLAAKTGIPIIPLTIVGSNKIMPKKEIKISSGKVNVIIDKPIGTSHIKSKNDELELMEKVRTVILNNHNSVK